MVTFTKWRVTTSGVIKAIGVILVGLIGIGGVAALVCFAVLLVAYGVFCLVFEFHKWMGWPL